MQTLRNPLFILSVSFFLLHQVLQHLLKMRLLFIDSYLDNLLAMPIILTLLVAERRHIFDKGLSYHLPVFDIVVATLYVSIISEWLFPWLSKRFIFDPLDFLFFFFGASIFYIVYNKPKNETANKNQ